MDQGIVGGTPKRGRVTDFGASSTLEFTRFSSCPAEVECERNAEGYSPRANGNTPMTHTTEATPENHTGSSGTETSLTAATYSKVSTADQNAELQRRELNEFAYRQGWHIVEVYEDVMSGAKASRPALNRLFADARVRKFGCVLVWKLDRFGRSLSFEQHPGSGAKRHPVHRRHENLDTDIKNPASRLLVHVLGAAAEFERALIRERTQAGHKRYKQDFESGRVGKTVYSRSGRNMPPHRPRKIFDREEVL